MELRHLLVGLGEKMTEEEVEDLIHGKEDAQVHFIFRSSWWSKLDRGGGGWLHK